MCTTVRMSCLLIAIVAITLPATQAADEGFVPLFNGKNLKGWKTFLVTKDGSKADPAKTWTIKDGIIQCTGTPSGYLLTEKIFSNYTLKVSWRYPTDVMTKSKRPNSGVLLHVTGKDTIWPNSVEAQLAVGGAGDLWLIGDEQKRLPKIEIDPARKDPNNKEGRHYFKIGGKDKQLEKPFGEWNQYEITCMNGNITLKVNGELANEAKNCELTRGRIALQSEGAPIDFKDVLIKEHK